MLTALSHSQIFVLDQDQALDFYVGKLGFVHRGMVFSERAFRYAAGPFTKDRVSFVRAKLGAMSTLAGAAYAIQPALRNVRL